MLADVRRAEIAEVLRTRGSISVADIEKQFGVSSMTARRDLADIEARGLARRTHGGAVMPTIAAHEDSFASRMAVHTDAKRALGESGAALVAEGESVFLDSSSTAYHVAGALLATGRRATVITNSLPVMDLIAGASGDAVDLVAIGGALRRLTRSFVGPVATAAIAAHHADRALFSVKGLTPTGALTDADPLEAEIKRQMVQHAATSVLLLDASKASTSGLAVVTSLSEVDQVLVEGFDAAQVDALRAHGAVVTPVAAPG